MNKTLLEMLIIRLAKQKFSLSIKTKVLPVSGFISVEKPDGHYKLFNTKRSVKEFFDNIEEFLGRKI